MPARSSSSEVGCGARRSEVLAFFQSLAPCLVGMEACATAPHWARELIALGHTVKLMRPAYVKAHVKRNRNDAADAEAICVSVLRHTRNRTTKDAAWIRGLMADHLAATSKKPLHARAVHI
jgi:transposase